MYKETAKTTLQHFSVHFLFIVIFYIISVYFGSSDYFMKTLQSFFNNDLNKSIIISIITTFSIIGLLFTFSVIISKKITTYDFHFFSILFTFGMDNLYFIFLNIGTILLTIFFLSIREGSPQFDLILSIFFFFTFSLFVKFACIHFDRNKTELTISND